MPVRTKPELVTEILQYFSQNPNAADTLDGIIQWRLTENNIRPSQSETAQALESLVSQGIVVARNTGAGTLYSLNRGKLAEVKMMLRDPSPHNSGPSQLTGRRFRS